MSEEKYPYATLEKDGYELEVVEEGSAKDHAHLDSPVPSDEERYRVEEGDVVMCIFHYEKPLSVKGKSCSAEHMWLIITGTDDGVLTGVLDNQPHYTNILKAGAELNFHPEHIVSIWAGE